MSNFRKIFVSVLFLIAIFTFQSGSLKAQVPFNTSPSWISTAGSYYSTGAAWADINRDGWLDLVISNGNDMARQKVAVYLNNSGTLPTSPNWQSNDIDYHGHLSVGDVNSDGYPDVAVSVYLGAAGFSQKGKLKLYINNNGTLSANPSWVSQDSFYTFSCAFGDADGDGDLDLAAACGESYNSRPDKNRIYYNNNGTLNPLPGWQSSEISYGMDVGWADFNNDGKLDLIFANESNHPNRMYRNYGDSIATVAAWSSTDGSRYANSLFAADVNNDGYLDFAVSDNNQLGGSGKFKIYLNNNGNLNTTPFWQSAFSGYGSGISFADVDFDNDADLVCGRWWGPCWVYLNNNGLFNTSPQWTSSTNSVVEAIVFADFNNNGLDTVTAQFTGNGIKKLYYVQRKPVQKIIFITVGTDTLGLNGYCSDFENGWVCFKNTPANGSVIKIKNIVSHNLDFAVSNWDPSIGNYVFSNNTPSGISSNGNEIPAEFLLYQNYPNPFNPSTTVKFSIPASFDNPHIEILIFDAIGRIIETLYEGNLAPRTYEISWDGSNYNSGVYFCKISIETAGKKIFSDTKKMILIK
jgi:FG-GAP-like repeat/Secretion system C-terminal sorting domain